MIIRSEWKTPWLWWNEATPGYRKHKYMTGCFVCDIGRGCKSIRQVRRFLYTHLVCGFYDRRQEMLGLGSLMWR